MRVDVVTIFPDYLGPLDLSLVGKARRSGLLEVAVHDLRGWTHDRHHTVDDTPYGGGAGMVMKPEPWGEALDALVGGQAPDEGPVLVVPTPSGERFTQAVAGELACEPWLVFACGRYEGIDQRVMDHARTRMRVREISIGDYVLNGGEVATLVVVEAVARLLPGFVGNPESLDEESHGDSGLLEYPVYTKPASWRGLDVPPVLLGGDHGKVAEWRQAQAVERTVSRRPDLLPPSAVAAPLPEGHAVPGNLTWGAATPSDVPELLVLQRACWLPEALRGHTTDPPHTPASVHETSEDLIGALADHTVIVLRAGGRLVAAVRVRAVGDVWEIGRLMVTPDLQGRGLGRWLLAYAESAAPPSTTSYVLETEGSAAADPRRLRRLGYRPARGGGAAGRPAKRRG